jgi:Transposase IS4
MNISAVGTVLEGLGLTLACLTTWQWVERHRMNASHKTAPAGSRVLCFILKIVVYTNDDAASVTDDTEMLHGSRVLAELLSPWAGSGSLVCADSYFKSVQAAEKLLGMGLKCIGV